MWNQGKGRTKVGQRPRKAPAHCRAPLYSHCLGLHCKVPMQLPVNQGTQTNASVRFTLPYTSASQQNAQVLCKHLPTAKLDNYKSPVNECKCLVHMYTVNFISHPARALVDIPLAESRLPVQSRVTAYCLFKGGQQYAGTFAF